MPQLTHLWVLGFVSMAIAFGQGRKLVVPVDGVEFEPKVPAVYSTYTQTVQFPDSRGIRKAQFIAEEKAKAAIVRFFGETSSSDRQVGEGDNATESAKRTQGGSADTFVKEHSREMSELTKEFTRSYSSGRLTGVTVVGRGYDEKTESAWVTVGFSPKTIDSANTFKQLMNNQDSGGGRSGPDHPATSAPDPILRPPSSVQRRDLPR